MKILTFAVAVIALGGLAVLAAPQAQAGGHGTPCAAPVSTTPTTQPCAAPAPTPVVVQPCATPCDPCAQPVRYVRTRSCAPCFPRIRLPRLRLPWCCP